jgi:hypothetical protein
MRKILIMILGIILFAGMATALTDTFRGIDARYNSGEIIVSGRIYTDTPGIIEAYCIHNDTIILVGFQEYTLANSADGKVAHFYIRSEEIIGCTMGDIAWAESGIIKSYNTTIHKSQRNNNIVYNPEEPAGVPEFGTIGLIIAVVGTMGVIVFFRRD